MDISGVTFDNAEKCSLFIIDHLSDELKEQIRLKLSGIYNGLVEATELPDTYTLEDTLASFIERYNSKDDRTKKGMIGELLTHILINIYIDNLLSLSILKNKEERSIKKGFDILYYEQNNNLIWYSEVKSGENENPELCSSKANEVLLKRSKNGILEMFHSRRRSLWESALIDLRLSVLDDTRRINIAGLLTDEIKVIPEELRKHVILVSVLYHDVNEQINFPSIHEFYQSTLEEDVFDDVLVISIQKRTYEAIATFLMEEIA